MRLALIIVLALFLWSGSVYIRINPQAPPTSQPFPSTCQRSSNGQGLLQALHKGTIVSIHDNGRELHIGIPGNWAAFSLEDQKTTIHQIHCYAQELDRQLRYTHISTPAPGLITQPAEG